MENVCERVTVWLTLVSVAIITEYSWVKGTSPDCESFYGQSLNKLQLANVQYVSKASTIGKKTT